MTRSYRPFTARLAAAALALAACAGSANGAVPAASLPITEAQRAQARQAAETGVPVADLAPGAPDAYTVVPHDTLWGISRLYLKSPWRWPELWGMNLEQVRNPHLIYPGQVLYLDRADGRARLRLGSAAGGGQGAGPLVRLSPQVRAKQLDPNAVASIPLNLIEPFLNEAIVFENDALQAAPRIVATQEGRVLLSRGDTAYVRGELGGATSFRMFRQARPLRDPQTQEVLGYEAPYIGAAELVRGSAEARVSAAVEGDIVPATFLVTLVRQEAGVGDRLAPVPAREFVNYVPHAPQAPITARIVSIYGDALTAGQNQIVALNRGAVDGMERGHVLALWRAGGRVVDRTDPQRAQIKLPDERHGMLFVFRVFQRVSYALILTVAEPVRPGDVATQP